MGKERRSCSSLKAQPQLWQAVLHSCPTTNFPMHYFVTWVSRNAHYGGMWQPQIIHVRGKIIDPSLQWWSLTLIGHGRLLDGRHPLMVSSVIRYQTAMCQLSITYKIMSSLKKGLAAGVRGGREFNYICGRKDVPRRVGSLIIYWPFKSAQHNLRKRSGSELQWFTLLLQTLALKSSSCWRTKLPFTICGLLLKMKRVRDVLVMLALVEAAVFRYLVFQGCEFSIVIRTTAYYIPLLTFQQWADGYPITNHLHLTYWNDLYTTCHQAKWKQSMATN